MVDFKKAISQYNPSGFFKIQRRAFSSYCPAYVTTNENLRYAMDVLKPNGAKVLTAAASGDQPMFYKLYGAAHIDTFDITYCSKAIMDLKTAAAQQMSYSDYIVLIETLHTFKSISDVPGYKDIAELCPADTRRFLSRMDGRNIFGNGLVNHENLPTEDEYLGMQNNINQPFNFIWSNLTNLSKHIDVEYNQIYLSNIFEYEHNPVKIAKVLNSLRSYLSVGGQIMVHATWFFRDFEYKKYVAVQESLKDWARMRIDKYSCRQEMLFLKKIR